MGVKEGRYFKEAKEDTPSFKKTRKKKTRQQGEGDRWRGRESKHPTNQVAAKEYICPVPKN